MRPQIEKTLKPSQNNFRILIFTGAYTRHRSRKVLVMEAHFELRRRGASGNDGEIVASEETLDRQVAPDVNAHHAVQVAHAWRPV